MNMDMTKVFKKIRMYGVATAATMVALPAIAGSVESSSPDSTVAAPAPVADFSGRYVSLYALGSTGTYGNDTDFPGDGEGDIDGDIGAGIALGYLWQRGALTFGPELNLAMPNSSGTEDCRNLTYECAVDVERLGSLRANVGYAVGPKTMVFGTAGIAQAKVNGFVDDGIGPQGETKNMGGWVIGIGVEHKMRENLSIRGAVSHYKFQEEDFQTDTLYPDVDLDTTTLEVGVTFRF